MLKSIVSARVPCLLFPRIRTLASCNPAFAPPKGTVLVSARNAAPLSEISKFALGIAFPAPSLSADEELLKNAYTVRLPRFGRSAQLVVAVIEVLPGLLALPAVKLKFTAFADKVRLTDSLKVAFRAMV